MSPANTWRSSCSSVRESRMSHHLIAMVTLPRVSLVESLSIVRRMRNGQACETFAFAPMMFMSTSRNKLLLTATYASVGAIRGLHTNWSVLGLSTSTTTRAVTGTYVCERRSGVRSSRSSSPRHTNWPEFLGALVTVRCRESHDLAGRLAGLS